MYYTNTLAKQAVEFPQVQASTYNMLTHGTVTN